MSYKSTRPEKIDEADLVGRGLQVQGLDEHFAPTEQEARHAYDCRGMPYMFMIDDIGSLGEFFGLLVEMNCGFDSWDYSELVGENMVGRIRGQRYLVAFSKKADAALARLMVPTK